MSLVPCPSCGHLCSRSMVVTTNLNGELAERLDCRVCRTVLTIEKRIGTRIVAIIRDTRIVESENGGRAVVCLAVQLYGRESGAIASKALCQDAIAGIACFLFAFALGALTSSAGAPVPIRIAIGAGTWGIVDGAYSGASQTGFA
jgi:hypothetical protein